jgi:hypothetical protein
MMRRMLGGVGAADAAETMERKMRAMNWRINEGRRRRRFLT